MALTVLLGAWTALSAEILGFFHALDQHHLVVAWGVFGLAVSVFVWRRGTRLSLRLPGGWIGLPKLWLAVACAYVLVLLVIALVAPPNTNDSLQYHMSRVAHWAQQASLAHYATPIERQLWMPPFAEIAVLNLYLLAGGDQFVNLVQWASMAISLVAVSLIARRLYGGAPAQAIAVLFAVTLPMGILQASSTQNDYVTGLWVICLAYFAVKAHQTQLSVRDLILAGLATGLGALTKATFYAFALPFLVWLGISTVRRTGWLRAIRFALLGLGLVVALNAGAWGRNLQSFGTPLGPKGAIAAHGNELWSWRVVVSNLLRNATLHVATPYGDVNGPMRDAVIAIHHWIGLDANDPRTSMGEYRVRRSFHEDYAGNPYHFLLVPACLLLLAWHSVGKKATQGVSRQDRLPLLYALVVLTTYLVFCGLYKWQPTGSRLQLPFFIAWAPAAGLAFQALGSLAIRPRLRMAAPAALGMLLVASSLRPLLINPSRPLIPRAVDGISLWNTPREELLFINAPEFRSPYLPLIEIGRECGCTAIGLKIDSSNPEYPFWALMAPPGSGIRLEHVDLPTSLGRDSAFHEPCAILCTYCTETSLYGLDLLFNHQGRYSFYLSASSSP